MENIAESLYRSLGIPADQLDRLIQRSPYTYKTYSIPKKSGGERVIAQPAIETKFVQKWLIDNIFVHLPVHECATAYKNGASILKNAEVHKDQEYIVKFDFKNFFSSIKISDLVQYFKYQFSTRFTNIDILRLAQISCVRHAGRKELCLSIGAPSSPMLSNAIMYEFDCEIVKWCSGKRVFYSRYADDLTFSTNVEGLTREIGIAVDVIVKKLQSPRLRINDKKTTHLSKKFQRRITGLIISNNNGISLGRDRKREISSLIHSFSIGILDASESWRLQGLIGFANNVEPNFIERMNLKYGRDVIQSVFHIRKPEDDEYDYDYES